jgi:alpha-ketoglutarate-dependent taurine dioxygenase
VRGRAETLDQDGKAIRNAQWNGNLVPHLTAQHKQWLNEIMDYVRAMGDARWT